MYLSFRFFLFVLFATAGPFLFGCSPKDRYFAPWIDPEPPTNTTKVSFLDKGTIVMGLREKRSFTIQVSPAGAYEVSFMFIGDALNGSLDRSIGVTDAEGKASFSLLAPNLPTTFVLRARLADSTFAELPVSVSGDGFSTLTIEPTYKGTRLITEWTATAVARKSCSEVSPTLPVDAKGALYGGAPFGGELLIHDAPVGPIIAVTVRAGHYAWGCTDTFDLIANQVKKVKINVVDKPMVLRETDLDVTFTLKPDQGTFEDIFTGTKKTMLDVYFAAEAPQASLLLLDDMVAKLPEADAILFSEARGLGDWDTLTTDHLAAQPNTLRGKLETWLSEGFATEPPELEGRVLALEKSANYYAEFKPLRIGSLTREEAILTPTTLMKLGIVSGDRMGMVAKLYWRASFYAGGVAKKTALTGTPEGTTIADVLSEIAACETLAQTLVGTATCDATSLVGICRDALATRFDRALKASAYPEGDGGSVLTISGIGETLVDDTAIPVSMTGQWYGTQNDAVTDVTISKGALKATPGADLDPP